MPTPLWGAPRIHGEMLKLGIEVSQATVGRHMVRRHGPPSPTWRTFLSNQVDGIAAIDMFVVVTAAFRLLYVSVILGGDRRLSPSPSRSHRSSILVVPPENFIRDDARVAVW